MNLQPTVLNSQSKFRQTIMPLAVTGLLVFFIVSLSLSRFFKLNAAPLSTGMTIDLVFVIPLIYLALSPKTKNSRLVTSLLFTSGIIIAGFVIPRGQQFYLTKIKLWVVPAMEILTITLIFIKVRAYRKNPAHDETGSPDFFISFKATAAQILPGKIAILLATEVSVFYFALFCRKKPVFDHRTFSYHKNTGSVALLGVFIFMIMVECTALHLLLAKWSPKVAWGFSALSLYAALQVFGMTRAMFKRPILITGETLILRYGLFSATTIPIATIAAIELSSRDIELNEDIKKLSPLKSFESHNTMIMLTMPNRIEGIYGTEKQYKTLLLHVDEHLIFKEELDKLLSKS